MKKIVTGKNTKKILNTNLVLIYSLKLDYKYIGRVKTDFNQIENLVKNSKKLNKLIAVKKP